MQPPRHVGIANRFAHGHGEGDDVVLDAQLQLIDPVNVNLGPAAQRRSRFFRHLTGFRKRFGGGQFHIQPLLEPVGVAPDTAHIFAGVAGNQVGVSRANLL